MKNNIMLKLDSIIEIKVSGKNIHNYIKRVIMKQKIDILKLTYLNYREVLIILRYRDYLTLCEYKSIYEISIVKKCGRLNFVEKIRWNFIFIIFLILGIFLIYLLSNVIFSIEIIHSSSEIREFLADELEKNGILEYRFKKGYYELEEIEDKILLDNKDKLEWIEIVEEGTKYIVRVEERRLNSEKEVFKYQSIVASKNCILNRIDAISGEKVRGVNDFVKKGDTVISGYITAPNGAVSPTMARGRVLGEVWYTIFVSYPYTYYEERLTGNSRKVLVLNFLDYKLALFQFKPYRSFSSKSKSLVRSNILNIGISLERQYEMEIISNIYTYDEVYAKAIKLGIDQLIADNEKVLEIASYNVLEVNESDEGINLKLFVKAIEDVGEVLEISDGLENDDSIE